MGLAGTLGAAQETLGIIHFVFDDDHPPDSIYVSDEVVLAKLTLNLAGADVTARLITLRLEKMGTRHRGGEEEQQQQHC